jgi:hypothetical protein
MLFDHDGVMAVAAGPEVKASPDTARYHAFDRVRALAMLLGVVYHALMFPMFIGGGGPSTTPRLLGDWMHSFRMPLFFLIAGFFGRMILAKYGTAGFLRRRWRRIGLPLMIGVLTFSPLNTLTLDQVKRPPALGSGEAGLSRPVGVEVPPAGGLQAGPSATPDSGGPAALPPGEVARRFFGPFARFFYLYHLWFLWYLLIFVTVAPFLAGGLAIVAPPPTDDSGDRAGLRLVRLGLAPALLAAAATPALLATRNHSDWFLGLAPAIFQTFPDILIRYDVDQLFYLVYFAAGWWLHRQRAALPSLAEGWLANAVVGLTAYGVAVGLQARYGGGPPSTGDPGIVRPVAVAVYCLGSACTCFAFLGVFLRFLDSPSRAWRYLADSALWVYLVHVPLVLLGLAACRPLGLPWWASTAVVSASSIAASLLLYEGLVRHTFLAEFFGPSGARPAAAVVRKAVTT